ncbi:MAG TPA: TonB family protein [Blastocatellia bacterium]|nr:TonB family protein [Blastocatellia bacterium]
MRRVLVIVGILLSACLAPTQPGQAGNVECVKDGGFSAMPAQDDTDITALMRAARDGEINDIEKLLKHGVDVNAMDSSGWTALIYASARGDPKSVKLLLKANADANAKDEGGYTALMAAAQYGHDSIVKLLLSGGADVNAVTNDGRTAIGLAAKSRRSQIGEILKKAGAQQPPAKPGPPIPSSVKSSGTQPVLLNSPMPNYTQRARDGGVQGVVHLRVLIGADGTVKRARVLIGLPSGLSYQAIEAALRLLFKPATMNGQPVAFWKNVIVEFRLR